MPFNSVLVASTAILSADLWQHLACLPERIGGDLLLELVLCFPLQQLGRWADYIWTYLCVTPRPTHRNHGYRHRSNYYGSSNESDEEFGEGGGNGGASSSSNTRYHCCEYSDSSSHSD